MAPPWRRRWKDERKSRDWQGQNVMGPDWTMPLLAREEVGGRDSLGEALRRIISGSQWLGR